MKDFEPSSWDLVPEHYRSTLKRYVERGRHPGNFGEALISNDLVGAAWRADKYNHPHLADLADFLLRFAPGDSFGSPEKFRSWRARGGLQGHDDEDAEIEN